METVRMNLLRSTSLDSEIASIRGRDTHIVSILLNPLRWLDFGLVQTYDDSLSQENSNKDDIYVKTVEDGNENRQDGNQSNDDDVDGDLNDDWFGNRTEDDE